MGASGSKDSAPGAWHSYASLKDGFDKLANTFGYLDVADEKTIGVLARCLKLDLDVAKNEMKKIDHDSNGLVSFAEFALWADRHTVGLPLGLESVPDKREWRRGIPAYWTSIPPEEPAAAPAATPAAASSAPAFPPPPRHRGGAPPPPPAEDDSELDDFIVAAKQFRWDAVWEILGRHPTYVNRRPDYRRYSAVHQAALFGDVGVLRRLVEECGADPRALTADGTTAQHVAAEHGHGEAAEFLEQCALEYAKKRARAEAACPAGAASMEAANDIIEKAKWASWDSMFALIEQHPGAVNLRPEFRVFGVIHQAAYHGDVAVLRRLVEECRADAGLLTRDKKTAVQVALDSAKLDAVKYLGSLSLPGGSSGAGTEEAQAHAVIDAAKDGKWEAVFRLLGEGPPGLVNIRPGVRRYSVLHQAAFHGDIEVLRRLIEDFKADVKQLTDEGQNALEIARLEKHDAAAKYLEACVPNVKLDDDFVTYPEQRFVTLGADELQTFRDLLRKTHKKACNWTRDRDQASGKHVDNTPVPTGYELVGVRRNENPALWRIYQVSREIMRLSCQSNESFAPWSPLTAEGLDWSPLGLCAGANEWLLLHAGLPEALSAIARTGFSMATLGSGGTTGGGGLYGSGTYFADSITKADEYARRKVEEKGVFKGCRAVAVVRVLGGRHYYTDKEVGEADKPKFAKRVLEGEYHSTVGDRLKLKNTYREYVAYDSACTYLEFILYYRRKGVPDKHK